MSKKSALGRGLDVLLKARTETRESHGTPAPPPEEAPKGERLAELPLALIDPNPEQPRREFDDETIKELSQSLKNQGVIQPVVVRESGGRHQLIAGERRVRAARLAGLETIPARILTGAPEQDLEKALVENIQREDLNPIHEALAFKQLQDAHGMTQEGIADRVGKSRATVTNLLRLLRLPASIQGDLLAGRLTEGHARAILAVDGASAQEALREEILRRGMSVRATEELVKLRLSRGATRGGKGSKATTRRPAAEDPQVRQIQDMLTSRLGTRVQIRAKTNKRGEIVLPYRSLEDFERIAALLGAKITGE